MLKSNEKLEKTEKNHNNTVLIRHFSLPAGLTCPSAGACKQWCYAQLGHFCYQNVRKSLDEAYKLSLSDSFIELMTTEINLLQLKNPNKKVYIRIHASGDFYNAAYAEKWRTIINNCPNVNFYCYTKSVSIVKAINWPTNMRIVYSFGGIDDHLIVDSDIQAHVVGEYDQPSDYNHDWQNGNQDDLTVYKTDRIYLNGHGARKKKIKVAV